VCVFRTPMTRVDGSLDRPNLRPSATAARPREMYDRAPESQWSSCHQAPPTSDVLPPTETVLPGSGTVALPWRQAVGVGLPWRTIVTTVRREVVHTAAALPHPVDMIAAAATVRCPARDVDHTASYPQSQQPVTSTSVSHAVFTLT